MSVELLDLAPVPGLAPAAKTLLAIWDAVENVDVSGQVLPSFLAMELAHHVHATQVNFNGCLRLAERCAMILLSVRQELHAAGGEVGQELAIPIVRLEE